MNKFKKWLYNLYINAMNKVSKLQDDMKNTRFTKKAPKFIATTCSAVLVTLTPTMAFAASTDTIDVFVAEIGKWLVKIGVVIAMVGGIMFALAWQREDAEGKSRGLLTLMAGFMIAAIGASPAAFGFTS